MPFTNSTPNPYTIVSNQIYSGSANAAVGGILFPSSVGRLPFFIQVVGSGAPLYVAYNGAPAGTGNFSVVLKAATSTYGADGGTWLESAYAGPVTVSGAIECRFVAWQGGRAA